MTPRSPLPFLGRYRLLRTIAASPERRVYLAEDLYRRGSHSVIKVFALEDGALDEARRVFSALRTLRHPGVAEIYDFGRLDPRAIEAADPDAEAPRGEVLVYFASAFSQGLDLRDAFLLLFRPARGERSAEGSGERWKIFLEALARIARALDAIHSRGIIHYDVKIENLLLDPEPSAARIERFGVKVLDFGLSERATTPIGTRARGTVPFLAPEIVDRSNADFRSDLFSFGVAIACAVSGRAPFPGSSPRDQMEAARSGNRIPLRSLVPEAPEALSEIVDRLLDPDPARRPASAASLAHALEEAGGVRLGPDRHLRTVPCPTVGWERELARVRAEIERTRRGEAEIACILAEGSEDCFLDRFADEASILAKAEGVRVVGGRSKLPREFAYQPFGEIISQILQHVDADAPRFARFAPVLELLSPSSRARAEGRRWALPPLDSPRAELYRLLDLVSEFFVEAARQVPLLVCVRELQQAGRESIDLLRSLVRAIGLRALRRPGASEETGDPPRILILGTVRSVETEGEPEPEAAAGLAQLAVEPCVVRLPLENLSIEETAGWIRERLPALKIDGGALRRLHERCSGSAAHLEEFVRRVEATAEDAPRGTAELSPEAISHALLGLPRKASKAALERFQHLPEEDRGILEALSAAGGSLRAEILEELAAGEGEGPAATTSEAGRRDARTASFQRRLAELQALGFLQVGEALDGPVVVLELPALANEIARPLPEGARRALHRRIALAAHASRAVEHPARVPEDVAFHALQGGLADLFVEESLRAAERLEAARAFEGAARIYEGALDLLGSRAPEGRSEDGAAAEVFGARKVSRAAITERLAEIYRETGQAQRSLEKLTVLASDPEVVSDPVRLASAYRRMGEVFSQSGEAANAAHFLERALGLLGPRAGPEASGEPASAADSVREPADSSPVLSEHLRSLLSLARLEASREDLARASEILAEAIRRGGSHPRILARAHLLRAEILQKRGLHKESLRACHEALDIARRDGGRSLLLEALRAVGSMSSDQGLYDRAAERFEEAIEVAASLESKFDLAACHSSLGTVYHNRADHEAALEHFRRSLALSSEIGDIRGVARSYNNLGLVHRIQDDLGRAAECYRRSIDLFTRVNDQQGIAAGMNNLASILELEGKYDEALEYSFRALEKRRRTRSRTGMAFSYYGIGRIYQAKGEIEKAISYAEKSLEIRRELGDKLGGAYASLLLSDLALSQDRYPDALRLAAGALDEFGRLGNEVGVLLARAARARVLAVLGDFEEARRSLEETLARARRSGQTALVGSCLLHLAALAAELGNPEEADARLVEAERLLRSRRGRRELVQVLLARASLSLSTGELARASSALEEAYSVLEDIGSRDLVPRYFLLRGRFELRSSPPQLEAAKNFLERGLVEARESSSRELRARFHHSLGILETMRGDAKLAAIHFEEAREVLEDLARSLPEGISEQFYRVRERDEIRSSAAGTRGDGKASGPSPGSAREESTGPGAESATAARHGKVLLDVQRQALKLHEVAAAMGSEANLQKLLETVLDAVVELVDAERGFLILKGAPGRGRSVVVARNLDREDIESPERKVSGSIARRVLRSGKPVLARNAVEDRRFSQSKSIRSLRVRSLVCVPLRFRGQTLGAIYLDNRHRRDAFSESQLDMLQAFADQAAVAVTNARLIEDNRKREDELKKANREMEALNLKLRRQVHRQSAELESAREDLIRHQRQLEARYRFHRIVGRSDAMQEVFYVLEKIFPTTIPVLIEGESGTGKDLVARAIHFNSPHRQGRFVSESCGALTESLFESELFGHVRGAFTGAVSDKKGLLEMADGGTLFLDDVEDLSPAMQQKLLRALAEKEIRRVGGKESRRLDVRLIAASSQDLAELVRKGRFRRDLYYRLNGILVRLPPLRERKEDIPLLVEHFASEFAEKTGAGTREFHPSAVRALLEHDWPGNVRELKHLVERTLLVAPGPLVRAEDLVFDPPVAKAIPPPRGRAGAESRRRAGARPLGSEEEDSLRAVREAAEREFVLLCLEEAGGNVSAAAKRCRVSRESFYRLIRKYRIRKGP